MKKISVLFMTFILTFSSILPVFASEPEYATEIIDDSPIISDGAIDFDLMEVTPSFAEAYYEYVGSEYYRTGINPFSGMMTLSDDGETVETDISLYSNIIDPDLSATSNMFSEADFENYTSGKCDPLNGYDPNYVPFYYASTESTALIDYCTDCTVHSVDEQDFCVRNRNICAYDAYQLLCMNDVFQMIKDTYVDYYIFIEPLNSGGKLQYTISIAGIKPGQLEDYAYPAFTYYNSNGGYGGKYTYAVHTPNTGSSGCSTIEINKYNSSVSFRQGTFNGNVGMSGGDTITILRSKLLLASTDILDGQNIDRANPEGGSYGDVHMQRGFYVPSDPYSLDYVDPLNGNKFDGSFGDYRDCGLNNNIGVVEGLKMNYYAITEPDGTDIIDEQFKFTWKKTHDNYGDEYYVQCCVMVVGDLKTVVGLNDKEIASKLILFDTVKYSNLTTLFKLSEIEDTSQYKDVMKQIDFSGALPGRTINISYDFYFRICKVDTFWKTYQYGKWTAMNRNRTNYDDMDYNITNGYTDAEGEYVVTDRIESQKPGVGQGMNTEDAENNIIQGGSSGMMDGLGSGFNTDEDGYANMLHNIMNFVGNIPAFIGALFTFLPPELMILLAFGLVASIVMIFINR